MVPVARDATVAYNGITCDNNVPCNSIPHGSEPTVLSFKGNRDYERILLGFDLPATTPKKCVLHIPKPAEGDSYNLAVVSTDSNWDEATVTGANKDIAGKRIATVKSPATTVDVSEACQAATGNRLSLFVDTEEGMVKFHSHDSGSADVFMLEC